MGWRCPQLRRPLLVPLLRLLLLLLLLLAERRPKWAWMSPWPGAQVEKGMVVQMGIEGGKPMVLAMSLVGTRDMPMRMLLRQLITQAWQCRLSALMTWRSPRGMPGRIHQHQQHQREGR